MSYEDSAGLNVHNQYGPRASGGGQGVLLTDGLVNQYVINLPSAGLYDRKIPVRNDVKITRIDLSFVTGTVTHIKVGATDVYDSTTPVTLPVAIPNGSTGVVVVTGGTGGNIVMEFENIAGDAFAYS